MNAFRIRLATVDDYQQIAKLHTHSWQTTYRGILSDEFLDNNLEEERKDYWKRKLMALTHEEFVLVAHDGEKIIGFIAVMDKPEKGYVAFIDNLHVDASLKGKGIGKQLMKAAAEKLITSGKENAYLWVLKGNHAAEKFYLSRGAVKEDETPVLFGGKEVHQTRFGWKTLAPLLN